MFDGKTIRFDVPGLPVGKGRARSVRAGKGIRHYTPEKTVNYEAKVAYGARQAMSGLTPYACAMAVTLRITVPIPESWSVRKRSRAAEGLVLPTTKPDVDNIEKSIFDAMNGICWKDDKQVVDVHKTKRYGEQVGVRVEICPAIAEGAC